MNLLLLLLIITGAQNDPLGQGGHRGAECGNPPGWAGDGGDQGGDHLLHGGPGLPPQAAPHWPGLQEHWGQG